MSGVLASSQCSSCGVLVCVLAHDALLRPVAENEALLQGSVENRATCVCWVRWTTYWIVMYAAESTTSTLTA